MFWRTDMLMRAPAANAAPLSRSWWQDRLAALSAVRPGRLGNHLRLLLLLALAPVLIVDLLNGLQASEADLNARRQLMQQQARGLANALDGELDTAIAALGAAANEAEATWPGLPAGFRLLINQIAQTHGAAVSVRNSDGSALLLSLDSGREAVIDFQLKAWRNAALAQMRPVLGNLVFSEPSHMLVLPVIQPIEHEDTDRKTLEMLIPADRLTETMQRHSNGPGWIAALINAESKVVAGHWSNQIAAENSLRPRLSALPAMAGEAGLRRLPGWRVRVIEDPLMATQSSFTPLIRSIVAAGVAVALGLVIVSLFSNRLTEWLFRLSKMARNVAMASEWDQSGPERLRLVEFEELRSSLTRADAVLRRRGAAERMALREARTGHELLVSVVNGTAESIHVKDLDLRYVLVNRAALHAGPAPLAEWQVLGKQTADLFPPELARRIEGADRRVLATGESTNFEQEYLAPGETSPRWIAMTIAPWQDAEGRVVGVVSVSRDVTRHRKAQVRLRKLQAELLRATRLSAMGAMASGLAHELNQPLAAATNYLNAGNRLLERGERGEAPALMAARGAVTDAAQQMLRAGAIVRRLRDFVDRGEVELQPEHVEELLRETCDLAISDGLPAGIELVLAVDDGLGRVLVDRTQIGQVLLNLLRNAAEAIQCADVPIQGRIRVSAELAPYGLAISVQDNGPGLAADIADRLFEPFVSSKRTGMGIGLSICRTIVEGHGGKLVAETGPGGGMIFRILLPVLLPQGEMA